MKLISWNLRGLNGLGKYGMIKNLIQKEKPHIFFMQETKCSSTLLNTTLSKAWHGYHTMAVDAIAVSGGLAITWNAQAIELIDSHANHHFIQAIFHIIGTHVHGHLTNVYSPQATENKISIMDTLSLLNVNRSHPLWIMGGDFNMITKLEEKIGGRIRLETESEHFK